MPDEDRLDPKIMRELEASGLPTVPTLALSGLPRSIWNRLMAPTRASQEVMKSGEIGAASVTPQQTLEMGSALAPAFGRASGGFGVAGSKGIENMLAVLADHRFQMKELEQSIKNGENLLKSGAGWPILEQQLIRQREVLKEHQAVEKSLLDVIRGEAGPGMEIGAGGGRPSIGGTRGSAFLNPTSRELDRFWNRVDAYKSIGRIAWAEGVSQHTIRARLESPFWARPKDFKPMSPQMVAQMDGLTAVTSKAPTAVDVERFWAVIGRYQRLKNWRAPVKQILGISDGVLDRRLNDPRWQRSAAKQRPDDELNSASFGGDPRAFAQPLERNERDRKEQRQRIYERYGPPAPKEVPQPSTPTGKMTGMSVEEFYGPITPLTDLKGAEVNKRWEGIEPDYEQLRPMVEQFGGAKIEDVLTPRESDNVEIERPPPDYTNPVPGPP